MVGRRLAAGETNATTRKGGSKHDAFSLSLSLSALAVLVLSIVPPAYAITHASSYKVPLTPAFPGDIAGIGCGVENSIADNCSGLGADLESPYTFSRGSLEIRANGRVGVKFDDIQVRKGKQCGNQDCFCRLNIQDSCLFWNDCDAAGPCLPGGAHETQVKVEIWAQGFWPNSVLVPDPCGDGSHDDCIRRSELPGLRQTCHKEFIFPLTTSTGDINALSATGDTFDCGTTSGPGAATIRRVEVSIDINTNGNGETPNWRLFARPSWAPAIDLSFQD